MPPTDDVATVKQALTKASSCDSSIPNLLANLFDGASPKQPSTVKNPVKNARTERITGSRSRAVPRDTIATTQKSSENLKPAERIRLATEVVNICLKSLSQEVQSGSHNAASSSSDKVNGTVLTGRSINVPCSPTKITKSNGPAPSRDGIVSVAECARLALATLRKNDVKSNSQGLPALQIEAAMSALVSKLIALELIDLACKEIRLLTARLGMGHTRGLQMAGKTNGTLKSDTIQHCLGTLLRIEAPPDSPQKLSLVIATQLHVLKILKFTKTTPDLEALAEDLSLQSMTSPANLIEMSIVVDGKEKVIRQLGTLAHAIVAVADQMASKAVGKASTGTNVASGILKLRLLSLEVSWKSWILADHNIEIRSQLWQPLKRYIEAYLSQTKNDSEHRLGTVKDAIETFTGLTRTAKLSDQQSKQAHLARLDLDLILQELSTAAGDESVIRKLGDDVFERVSSAEISGARKAVMFCRAATSAVQKITSSASSDLSQTLERAVTSFSGSVDGSSEELDELFLGISTLRKALMKALTKYHEQTAAKSPTWEEQAVKVVVRALAFASRYLGKPLSSTKSANAERRYEERRSLVAKTGRGAIESVIYLAKQAARSSSAIWNKYEQPLKDCLLLAEQLQPSEDDTVNDKTSHIPVAVLVSNVYWLRYLSLRQSGTKHSILLSLLIQSTDTLRPLSTSHQKTGLLPNKLERLAYVYEQSENWNKAASSYRLALEHCISSGQVQTMAEKLRWVPMMNAIREDVEFKIVGKLIEGYSRCRSRLTESELQICSKQETNDILYGFVLELQLSCLCRSQHVSLVASTSTTLVEEIGQRMLDVYRENTFPIRRLRALSSLAQCDVFMGDSTQADCSQVEMDPAERHLLPFHDHLIARNHAILGLKQMQQSNLLTTALEKWVKLVSHKSITTEETLSNRIGDLEDWRSLLNTIAGFCEAHGLIEQRICALDLLAYTTKLSPSYDTKTFARQIISLSTELTYLGYPHQADKVLHSIQKVTIPITSHVTKPGSGKLMSNEQRSKVVEEQEDNAHVEGSVLLQDDFASMEAMTEGLNSPEIQARKHFLASKQTPASQSLTESIFHIKQSLKLYLQVWSNIERKYGNKHSVQGKPSVHDPTGHDEMDATEEIVSHSFIPATADTGIHTAHFWALIRPLFETLMYAFEIHLRCGLIVEARYYVLEALKIAEKTTALPYIVRALASQANLEARCGDRDQGSILIQKAKDYLKTAKNIGNTQRCFLQCLCLLGFCPNSEDFLEDVEKARETLNQLIEFQLLTSRLCASDTELLSEQLENLKLTKTKQRTLRPATSKSINSRSQTLEHGRKTSCSSTYNKLCPIERLKDELLKLKVDILLAGKDDPQTLDEAEAIVQSLIKGDKFVQNAVTAVKFHLEKGFANLQLDPLLNIVPEAILAQPVVTRSKPYLSVVSTYKGPKAAKTKRTQETANDHSLPFNKAASYLFSMDSASVAELTTLDAHALGELGIKTLLTLTAIAFPTDTLDTAVFQLGNRLELGRNVASISAQAVIEADKLAHDVETWAEFPASHTSVTALPRADQFQQDFLDIIPQHWHVVSISLSADRSELRLGTFKAATAPFMVSIPLSRESRDGAGNVFTFDQGKKELARIIDLANYSTHEAIDYTKRGAKAEWWEARAALDSRLRDLLMNVENIWLSGFKGLLMNCFIDEKLADEFEKSFIGTMNRHLPSRQKKKGTKTPEVALNRTVFEAFLRLGNPKADPNIDESILDLLYFVVDVLWFNGEKNTCDEIDFDPIVVETQDALTRYHEGVKQDHPENPSAHTILILDKRLHAFPWESLPCISGQSVSRLPSLYCLRQRILHMHEQQDYKDTLHYSVDRSDGTFVLNPSGDLKSTQASFEQPLSKLSTWSSVINKVPKEDEIVTALSTRALYMYFGHGSGGQYVRTRAIRRLNQCAVSLLMGCSSGTFMESGEFESYGTPLAYLHAGAPAVVGTLWDVTDKDIDRFSMNMLERWGLLDSTQNESAAKSASPRKRTVKAKGKQRQDDETELQLEKKPNIGLDTAIAQARGSCIMRYLNGAAAVVYGIPVYLK